VPLESILLLVTVGLFGGAWNAMASGASLFTFPVLLFVGLPPVTANATNFLALLPGNLAALPAYRQELRQVGREVVPLLAISCSGATAGSLLLLASDEALFVFLIPYLVLAATLLFLFAESLRRALLRRLGEERGQQNLLPLAILFLFSIYGGYFGAGIGMALLAAMQMLGYRDFHLANALKNLLAVTLTLCSILVFGLGGALSWPAALAMMVGSTAGGYLGAHLGRRARPERLRAVVIAFGFALSAYYFYSSP